MHIDIIPNRASSPTILLRESYREGKKVKKRTLANLSSLPMEKVEMIRQVLRGDVLMLIPVPQADQTTSRVAVADIFKKYSPDHLRHIPVLHSSLKRPGMEKVTTSIQSRKNINPVMAARKSGLGSTLATAFRRSSRMDSKFKV